MKVTVLFLMFGLFFTSTNAQKDKNNSVNDFITSKGKKSEARQNARAEKKRKRVIKKLVEELSSYLQVKGAKNTKPKRVTVITFLKSNNELSEFGRFLAEEFSISLFKTKKFLVVDRSQIQTLMEENKIGSTGTLNPAEVARLGKAAGVQIVVTGTITMVDNQFNISIKGIDVERSLVAASAEGSIPRTQGFDALYNSVGKAY